MTRRLTQPALYGFRRKSSAKPSPKPQFRQLWDIEKEISQEITGRRNTVNPIAESISRRKASEGSTDASTQSSINSTNRGLKPDQIEPRDRRGSSELLRKSLQNSIHSPYSVWPGSHDRFLSPSAAQHQLIRRRTLFNPTLEPQIE